MDVRKKEKQKDRFKASVAQQIHKRTHICLEKEEEKAKKKKTMEVVSLEGSPST